ncbi:MAG: CoA transferase [Candidatus Binataceae bacterium]|nr:CoA transferase [Candidatus Binataceae bacterium]
MNKPPLTGIRVADFTWVWAGPYCTMQLAHMGADVIRVESQTRMCVSRLTLPWAGGKTGPNRSGYFNQYNQGKRSIALNLKLESAREAARRLASKCDVVINNFAAGVMDRLGLGYADLARIKPDIIGVSLTGYGDSGPLRDYVAYGPAQVPLSGMSALTGYRGWPPMHVGFSYGDPNAGTHAAFAIIAALYHRERTGEGQYLDMSQWESTMALMGEAMLDWTMNQHQPERDGSRDPSMAPHGVFRCRDMPEPIAGSAVDMWVAIAVAGDDEFARFSQAVGRAELARDDRFATLAARKKNEDELEAIVTQWTSQRLAADAAEILQNAGVTAAVCATGRDLDEDPHLNERGFFVEHDHLEIGRVRHAGIPFRMSETPLAIKSPAPLLGQHTDEVLRDLLGYSAGEIENLRAEGALK